MTANEAAIRKTYKVAEDRRVCPPCAISCDGAFRTHSQALVKIPSQAQVDSFLPTGYTKEEMKMENEGRKIMHHPNFRASVTCVRVPVYRAHSVAVTAEFDKPLSSLGPVTPVDITIPPSPPEKPGEGK